MTFPATLLIALAALALERISR
jgi:hypothetical protein